jgi:septal ring factor EnvC (AmiA/AmiB activator)
VDIGQLAANVFASITVSGATVATVQAIANRRKISAQAEQIQAASQGTIAGTARELLLGVTDELKRLREQLKIAENDLAATRRQQMLYETRLQEYKRRIEYLTDIIEDSGIPVEAWRPRMD